MTANSKGSRIVHITPVYWDGWGYQENILAEYQAKLGHEVTVIAPAVSLTSYRTGPAAGARDYCSGGVRVIRLRLAFEVAKRFYAFAGLPDLLRELAPDVIMVHGIQTLALRDAVRYARAHPSCVLCADVHSDADNSARNRVSRLLLHRLIWRSLVRSALPSLRRIYCTRPSVLRFARETYDIPQAALQLLPIPVDSDAVDSLSRDALRGEVRGVLSIPDDAVVVCTGGKLDESRRLRVLAEAVHAARGAEVHLIIFGAAAPEYAEELKQLQRAYSRIHVVGWLAAREIYRYLLAADAAIFLGLHSVLWEQCVGSGTPLIVPYAEDFQYLDVGGNVRFLHTRSADELIHVLEEWIAAPERLAQMRAAATERGRARFSAYGIARQLGRDLGIEGAADRESDTRGSLQCAATTTLVNRDSGE